MLKASHCVPATLFLALLLEISADEAHSVKKDSPTPVTGGNSSTSAPTSSRASPDTDSLQTAFLAFAALGILLLFFIVFRSFRLRTSRAERRYGVLGDRSAQELTPLPMAMDEDSGDDEQTLFDASHSRPVL